MSAATNARSALTQATTVVVALVMVITVLPAVPADADDHEPAEETLRLFAGLANWARALDGASELDPVAEPLPLTVASVGNLTGLDAGVARTLVGAALEHEDIATGPDDPGYADALAAALASAAVTEGGDPADGEPGFHARFEDVIVAVEGEGDAIDVAFILRIDRIVDVPLFYDEPVGEDEDFGPPTLLLHDGFLRSTVAASGAFAFTLDRLDDADGGEFGDGWRFELDPGAVGGDPRLDVTITVHDDALAFSAAYGLAGADAAGSAELELDHALVFVDPGASDTGTISERELADTNPLDLFTVTFAEQTTDVALILTAAAPLDLPGEAVEVTAASAGAGWSYPADRQQLADEGFYATVDADASAGFVPFDKVGVEQVLVGLTEAGLALREAQTALDVPLPLLDGGVADVFQPGEALITFSRERSEALISCGSADTSPPEGLPRPGGVAHCQAFTSADPVEESVQWSLTGGGEVNGAADDDRTVGQAPTANVSVPTERIGDLAVTWQQPSDDPEDDTPVDRRGVSRFETVQELAAQLEAAGFGAGDLDVGAVDGLDHAVLSVGLDNDSLPTTATLPLRVDDELRPGGRVLALRPTDDTEVTVTLTNPEIAGRFGIVLDPEPTPDDERVANDAEQLEERRSRFLLRGGDEHLLKVDALDAAYAGTLEGRVGYLPVTATIDRGTVLATPSGPAVLAQIDPDDTVTEGALAKAAAAAPRPAADSGWVRLADLIAYFDPYAEDPELGARPALKAIDTAVTLAFDGALAVAAAVDGLDQSGGLDLAWSFDDTASSGEVWLSALAPAVSGSPDAAYRAQIRPFDVTPEVAGTVDEPGDDPRTTLRVDGADFPDQFSLPAGTEVERPLFNATTGGSCSGFVIGDDTLTCDDPLGGGGADETAAAIAAGVDPNELDGDEFYEAPEWSAGDRFVVEGDPDKLGSLAVRGLARAAAGLAHADNDAFAATLPLADVAPAELVDHLAALAEDLDRFVTVLLDDQGGTVYEGVAGFDEDGNPVDEDGNPVDAPVSDALEDGAAAVEDLAGLPGALAAALDGVAHVDLTVETLTRASGEGEDSVTLPHLVVSFDVVASATGDTDLRIDTGADGTLLEEQGGGALDVTHTSITTVAAGVPLLPGPDTGLDPADVVITHDTGIDLAEITVVAKDGVGTSGRLGGVELGIGQPGGVVTSTVTAVPDDAGGDPQDASATELIDDTKDFGDLGVAPGDLLTHVASGETCAVTAVATTQLTCDGLPEAVFAAPTDDDPGSAYRVEIAGTLQVDLAASATLGVVDHEDDASLPADFFARVTGDVTGGDACDGLAGCAAVSLRRLETEDGEDSALGTLSYELEGLSRTATGVAAGTGVFDDEASAALSEAAADGVRTEPLDFLHTTTALRFVLDQIEESLDGQPTNTLVPLVGYDLDAGAGVVGTLNEQVAEPLEGIDDEIARLLEDDFPDADENDVAVWLQGELEQWLVDAGAGDVLAVDVSCADEACTQPEHVDEIRFTVTLAAEAADGGLVDGSDVPFDMGVEGLPITPGPDGADEDDTSIATEHRWQLEGLTFGIARTTGPFVGEDDSQATVLGLEARARFANGQCSDSGERLFEYLDGEAVALAFSPERCGDAVLGILPGRVYDGGGSSALDRPSFSHVETTVALADGRLDFGQLLDRRRAPVTVAVLARIDVAFETNRGRLYEEFIGGEPGMLPGIVGTFHARVDASENSRWPEPIYLYDNLAVDPGDAVDQFLRPITSTVTDVTDPFMPVINLVSTPVPVISDLSEMTGGDPVTLLKLLDAISANDLTLLIRLVEVIAFANALGTVEGGFIPLGEPIEGRLVDPDDPGDPDDLSITVDPANRNVTFSGGGFEVGVSVLSGSSTTVDLGRGFSTDGSSLTAGVKKENTKKYPDSEAERKFAAKASVTMDGATLSLPFLQDPDEVFGMLVGRDAALVRVDLGTLSAKVSMSITYGPFMAGPIPVPLDVGVGGSVTLKGRMVIGFDTYGFSKYVRGTDPFLNPFLDGLYLDDLDADGNDVDEIQLIVAIQVEGALSVKIVRAGLAGEVSFTLGLNLHDRRGDGRIRIEDVWMFQRSNPLCLFEARGLVGFKVGVFVEIKIPKARKDFTLWELDPKLQVFEVKCSPPEPEFGWFTASGSYPLLDLAAGMSEAQPAGIEVFALTMGAFGTDSGGGRSARRGVHPDERDEAYTVRQLTAEGGVEIVASGALAEDGSRGTFGDLARYWDAQDTSRPWRSSWGFTGNATVMEVEAFGQTLTYLVPEGATVWADTGGGIDTLRLDPGVDEETGEEIVFTHDAVLVGGAGGNRFSGGDGRNVIVGGSGDDSLRGGRQDDLLFSGGGDNTIDGVRGNNLLVGGAGDDRISGGPGSDLILGGGGDNLLEGGPGLRPGSEPPGRFELTDTGNVILGGDGSDALTGGPSTDYLLVQGLPGGIDDVLGLTADVGQFLRTPPERPTSASQVATARAAQRWAIDLLGGDPDHIGDPARAGELAQALGAAPLDRGAVAAICEARGRLPDDGSVGGNTLDTQGADSLLMGGWGDDRLRGGRGDDVLCVPGGSNVLEGNRGDNELHGGRGDDRLVGGSGDDWLTGGGGENLLEAGEGRNVLMGGVGSDVLLGGAGGELLVADAGPQDPAEGDPLLPQEGVTIDPNNNDPDLDAGVLRIGEWKTRVVDDGGAAPERFTVEGLHTQVAAGQTLVCRRSAAVLGGLVDLEGDGEPSQAGRFAGYAVGAGDDAGHLLHAAGGRLNGIVAGVDVLDGRLDLSGDGAVDPDRGPEGADTGRVRGAVISTEGRANCVLGGDAEDAAFGGPGGDWIDTAFGDDFVDAGPGANSVRGGPGDTVIFGGPGTDVDSADADGNQIFGDSGDDVVFGGPARNRIDGGPGDDYLEGNAGGDVLRGGAGDDVVIGGSSGIAPAVYEAHAPGAAAGRPTTPRAWWRPGLHSGSGDDVLHADAGDNLLVGDNARIGADGGLAFWDEGREDDWLATAVGGDAPFAGDDALHGGLGDNALVGGLGDDALLGNSGNEHLFGDLAWFWPTSEQPWETGAPAWHPVLFDDEGGPWWRDTVRDSAATTADDDAGITTGDRPTSAVSGRWAPADADGRTHWPGGAPRYDVELAAPNVGGDDYLYGGPGDDHVFGGAGDDRLEGGPGEDYLEGGPGDDELYGDTRGAATGQAAFGAGHDEERLRDIVAGLFGRFGALATATSPSAGNDVIGGSSAVHPDAADPLGPGAPSGNNLVVGADGEDVLAGDNAEITRRTADEGDAWAVDPITGGRVRGVALYDLHRLDDPEHDSEPYTVSPERAGSGVLGGSDVLDGDETVGGADVVIGVRGHNRMYGGPGEDYLRGGPGRDYVEGGPGDDWIEGGSGDDDLIGGGAFTVYDEHSGSFVSAPQAWLGADTEGFPSGANVVLGQDGQNVLAGDNARVVRRFAPDDADEAHLVTAGRFVGFADDRWVFLRDLDHQLEAVVGGEDVLSAGPGNSLVFGQGSDDWVSGGGGEDYAEGGAGDDVLFGDRRFGLGPDQDEAGLAFAVLDGRPTILRRGHTVPAFAWPGAARAVDAFLNDFDGGTGPTSVANLEGAGGTDGQDDLIGGNAAPGLPAGNNTIYGDGNDDVLVGDNSAVIRTVTDGAYERYDERYDPDYGGERTIVRTVVEYDAGASLDYEGAAAAAPFGDDFLDSGSGDDTLHGQDGDDELWGSPRDDVGPDGEIHLRGESWGDHLVGGLGDDRLYGGPGHDVLIGDRGAIITRFLADDSEAVAFTRNGPPFLSFTGLEPGDLWHQVNLYCKEDRSPVADGGLPRFFDHDGDGCALGGSDDLDGDPAGLASVRFSAPEHGGADLLRGGRGDTVIYGGGGNDVLQGDEGADVLFGGTGHNVLYGGEGEAGVDSTNPRDYARADDRAHVDWLFGGRGESLLDYRPRVRPSTDFDAGWADPDARLDPDLWFEMTRPYWHPDDVGDDVFALLRQGDGDLTGILEADGTVAEGVEAEPLVDRAQHHQGVAWAYGGWGRKVHQSSVSANGPNPGDRLMDWTGAYNLYTHCAPHYGSHNILRALSPAQDEAIHTMALIGGAGPDIATLQRPGTSGFDQIAFVHPRIARSVQANSGPAFTDDRLDWGADLPGLDEDRSGVGRTPGHFYDQNIACPDGGVADGGGPGGQGRAGSPGGAGGNARGSGR